MSISQDIDELRREHPLVDSRNWWHSSSQIYICADALCAMTIQRGEPFSALPEHLDLPEGHYCKPCTMVLFTKAKQDKSPRLNSRGQPVDALTGKPVTQLVADSTSKECTCPQEVWMHQGCKCGAVVPYVVTF